MKLILGAGQERWAGWVSVDLDPKYSPTICADVRDLATWIEADSIEYIRACDVLEHLPYRDTDRALREWFRVLKPGGGLYVQVPAADVVMRWWTQDPAKLIHRLPPEHPQTAWMGLVWRLMGGQEDGVFDGQLNLHQTLFSSDSLHAALVGAGFEIVQWEVGGHPNYHVEAVKPEGC